MSRSRAPSPPSTKRESGYRHRGVDDMVKRAVVLLAVASLVLGAYAVGARPRTVLVTLYQDGTGVRSWVVRSIDDSRPGKLVLNGGEVVIYGPAAVVVAEWREP